MPLLNITLKKGKDADYICILSQTIHHVLINAWNIPENDYFHIVHQMDEHAFMINQTMWDMQRSDDVIVIHITSMPRTTQMKLDFYQQLPQALEEKLGIKPDDVFISIVTNQPEDWSFGKGKAQLLKKVE
ncbi:MAG: tautomerase family protein [Pseudomonadota bacterium]|nr:tautomerase family protein [Pseudomonadota bacterium]